MFGELQSEGAKPNGSSGQARRTELIRDVLGRLIEKRAGSQLTRYRYDRADQLVEAIRIGEDGQPLHTVRFDYDALGRIVKESSTDQLRGTTHTLVHEHDELGNRIRTSLPELAGQPERNLHYLYYGSGHLHHVRLSLDRGEGLAQQSRWHVLADFERDDLHREILRSQGALSTRYQLDPLGRRLASHAHRGTGLGVLAENIPQTTTFDYDALGRRIARVDAFGRTEFIWEGLRLIEERRGS